MTSSSGSLSVLRSANRSVCSVLFVLLALSSFRWTAASRLLSSASDTGYASLTTSSHDCDKAVALHGSGKTNEECRDMCLNSTLTSATSTICSFVDYRLEGTTVKSDDCYAAHLYGYVRAEGYHSRVGYKHFVDIATPHLCQLKCQEDSSQCVNFVWTPPTAVTLRGEPNCFLKSQVYIDRAWLGSGKFNDEWCNSQMSALCLTQAHYECVGVNTCIWCSHEWLSGPTYCEAGKNGPQAGADGFPICDGIPDLHITTTPSPGKPTRPPDVSTFPLRPITTPSISTSTEATPPSPTDPSTSGQSSSLVSPSVTPPGSTDKTSAPVDATTKQTSTNVPNNITNLSTSTPSVATGMTSETVAITTPIPPIVNATEPAALSVVVVAAASAGGLIAAAGAAYGAYAYFASAGSAVPQLEGVFEGGDTAPPTEDKEQGVRVLEEDFLL